MRIIMSGTSGLIGSHVRKALEARGDTVIRLVRRQPNPTDEVHFDVTSGILDLSNLPSVDAVIHLAGENIGAGRWTESRKKRILDSRVKGTSLIAKSIAALDSPPKVMISASAIGFYGDQADKELTEQDPAGEGFLPMVCLAWEGATEPARQKGIRVVNPRLGIVLSREGGALPKMARPMKFGLGGKFGDGRQFMSWVMLEDVVAAILFALDTPTISGPVNITAPGPVTNEAFTRALAQTLRRPAPFTVPRWAIRLLLGEMGEELLFASIRVEPERLQGEGFRFTFSVLDGALAAIYRR